MLEPNFSPRIPTLMSRPKLGSAFQKICANTVRVLFRIRPAKKVSIWFSMAMSPTRWE